MRQLLIIKTQLPEKKQQQRTQITVAQVITLPRRAEVMIIWMKMIKPTISGSPWQEHTLVSGSENIQHTVYNACSNNFLFFLLSFFGTKITQINNH